jgi:CheY-like chemotaxis protein
MPGMDGLSWVRALRQDRRWQSLPVLVISTPSDQQPAEDLLRQSLDAGADAFLPKPLDASELARQVQSLLEADTDA